ncbi:MAG: TonB family protein [Alphaproteobacteria bacterium]|nr:TonB family protein [Alphaproteobacteria bacterium]
MRLPSGRALPLATIGSVGLHAGILGALLWFAQAPEAGAPQPQVTFADLVMAKPSEAHAAPPQLAGADPAERSATRSDAVPVPPRPRRAEAGAAPQDALPAVRIGEPWERSVASPSEGAPDASTGEPVLEHRVAPRYPRRAERAQMEGLVVLGVAVAGDGRVSDLEVLRAEPAGWFEEAALEAVSQWRYQPLEDGAARERLTVEIRFELH